MATFSNPWGLGIHYLKTAQVDEKQQMDRRLRFQNVSNVNFELLWRNEKYQAIKYIIFSPALQFSLWLNRA